MTATATHLVTVGRSSLYHIEGLSPVGQYGPTAGSDTDAQGRDRGYVSYVPSSACGTLSGAAAISRSYVGTSEFVRNPATGKGRRVSTATVFTPAEALEYAARCGWQVCARCAKAAQ